MTRALEQYPSTAQVTDTQDPRGQRRGADDKASTAPVDDLGRGAPAPKVANSLVAVVVLGYITVGFCNIYYDVLGWNQQLIGDVCFVGIGALQILHSSARLAGLRNRLGLWTLLVQAVLSYFPLLFGVLWGGMTGFLGASALLMLPTLYGWLVFSGVVVAAAFSGPLEHWSPANCVYVVVSTALTALVVFGLTRLAQLVVQVQAARLQLAELAVTRERLRFSRDLHDLLGYSLSAITLKSELTRRLVIGSPELALDEIAGILEISRQALLDVRVVARGYRAMSLGDEVEAARSVLEAAEIDAAVDLAVLPPDGHADTILATVLREAVTNLLRHSKAEHCRIATRREGDLILLTVANDGLVRAVRAAGADRDGSGLGNLTARLAEVGGRLTWGVDDGDWFVLTAEIPIA
jgi:two-component system sensor histidine kinase DesK